MSREWYGLGLDGKALHVGPLPGRRQVCLYFVDGSRLRTVAFFKREKDAAETLRFIDALVRAGYKPEVPS